MCGNMTNKKVSLVRKCEVPDDGWRYYLAVMSAKGRPNRTQSQSATSSSYPIGHHALNALDGPKLVYPRIKGGAPRP